MDNDTLKIAQGRRKRSGTTLLGLRARPVKGLGDDQIAEILREAVASLPGKPRDVEFLLPRHYAIVRTLELPSTDNAELRELASFQAVKQTPYASDEMVLDTQVLEKGEESSKVSLVVVQREVVERLLDIAQKANLRVRGIRLGTQAYEAMFLAWSQRQQLAQQKDAIGFVSIDVSRTHVLIRDVHHGLYSRSIPLGWQTLKEGEDGQKKWTDELATSFSAFQKENPRSKVGKIYFDADVSALKPVGEFLRREGAGAPLFLDPQQIVQVDSKARVDVLDGSDISRSSLLGGLIMPMHLAMNLLPEASQQKMQSDQRRRNAMQLLIASGVLLVLCLAYYLEGVLDKKWYLGQLQQKTKGIATQASSLESRSEQLDLLRSIAKNQGEVAGVLREVYRLIPDSMALTSLSYERGRALILKGTAKDLSDVFQLIPALEKSDAFENVASQYASKRKSYDKEFADFQLQCHLSKSPAKQQGRP